MRQSTVIRICYRKIIDASATAAWDRQVREACYAEYRMQAQFFNTGKKYNLFSELLAAEKGAAQLHFLVSAAATGYLQQLGAKMPDLLDNLGLPFLDFTHFRFEIVEADSRDASRFRCAIYFFSQPLHWHATIDGYLLLAVTKQQANPDGRHTHLFRLPPFVSIYSIQTDTYETTDATRENPALRMAKPATDSALAGQAIVQ